MKLLGGRYEKYEQGFCVYGKHQIETVEWLFNEKYSDENRLQFQAFDANMCPLPDFSKWENKEWNEKQINKCLKFTVAFDGEVWLDDIRIK